MVKSDEQQVRRFLREKESRGQDPNHFFTINQIEDIPMSKVPVRVPETAEKVWRCDCNFKDMDLGYDKDKFVYVFKLTGSNGERFMKKTNEDNSSISGSINDPYDPYM